MSKVQKKPKAPKSVVKAKTAPKPSKSTKDARELPGETPKSILKADLEDSIDFSYFEKYFIAERDKITLSHKQEERTVIGPDDKADEADMASAELSQEMQLRLRNRELLYLKKIDEALHKIRICAYGECESCGSSIGMKRLMARPTAALCIMCKTEQESQENKSADGKKSKSLGSSFFPKS